MVRASPSSRMRTECEAARDGSRAEEPRHDWETISEVVRQCRLSAPCHMAGRIVSNVPKSQKHPPAARPVDLTSAVPDRYPSITWSCAGSRTKGEQSERRICTRRAEGMASTKQFIIALALALGFIAASDLYADDLHGAAKRGDTDAIRMLLAAGADPNARAKYRLTPLHYAAYMGHADATQALLAAGADSNVRDVDGTAPIYFASSNGHTDVIRALLAAGADPNVRIVTTSTPLHATARKGHTGATRALLAGGGRPECQYQE